VKKSDLKYDYPEKLVAQSPVRPSRVMWVEENQEPIEITPQTLLDKIPSGDVFVINDTQVLRRRVFVKYQDQDLEFLFLDQINPTDWFVLFPARDFKIGTEFMLPNGRKMVLLEKGLPQKVKVDHELFESDFERMGELPLPPYIQKARGVRHNDPSDQTWYQTAWAEVPGGFAAPTASLHFSSDDLLKLAARGVHVVNLTLHVGLGTFLPVKVEDLDQHQMHKEIYSIKPELWDVVERAKREGRGIWALGTTVTRTLETVARSKKLTGESELLLQVGSEFKIVNRLLTNFHQPESTLLALVAAFAGLAKTQSCYRWAIEKNFRLFSYGDLSVWIGKNQN
jgi:S-adenosylmethionine:tRNA ribosyltransferase-isomerase